MEYMLKDSSMFITLRAYNSEIWLCEVACKDAVDTCIALHRHIHDFIILNPCTVHHVYITLVTAMSLFHCN